MNMERVTEFAVTYRYPDADLKPITKGELEQTIKQSQDIFNELSSICLEDTPLA